MSRSKLAAFLFILLQIFFYANACSQANPGIIGKLGIGSGELTPVGAERAGNKEGTIPPWTGGLTRPPAGRKFGEPLTDPFALDKPIFRITGQNFNNYNGRLTAGQIAMFEKYPNWKVEVYPTRRSASFPDEIYENTIKNARAAHLVGEGAGTASAREGIPFPVLDSSPATAGLQAIWNHRLRPRGIASERWNNRAAPTASGSYSLSVIREANYEEFHETSPGLPIDRSRYTYEYVEDPQQYAGQRRLIINTIGNRGGSQTWRYDPASDRRVRTSLDELSGDYPQGIRPSNMRDMFSGEIGQYDWKLVGKKEIYSPYNAYVAHGDRTDIKELVRPGFLNPDLLRYELHRLWVVEATPKPGMTSLYSKSTYYLDEDSWQIIQADHYDKQGKLWQYSEAPVVNLYDVPMTWAAFETHHDLKSGRYVAEYLYDKRKPEVLGSTYDCPKSRDEMRPQGAGDPGPSGGECVHPPKKGGCQDMPTSKCPDGPVGHR